jgi:putative phosphoesterase
VTGDWGRLGAGDWGLGRARTATVGLRSHSVNNNYVRIAVIADIHGNLPALEAVRADLRRHAPDMVVNLGDHLSGPLQAAATADLLIETDYLHIRGNHDRQLLDRPPARMGASDQAAFGQLTTRHKAWLNALPATKMLGEQILLCHGTPESDLEYLMEDIQGTEVRLRSPEGIQLRLGSNVRAVLCGHSHIPRIVRTDAGVTIVNPGSVGLQAYDDIHPCLHYVETGSPHARYAVIDQESAAIKVDFIAVEYDWEQASRDAAAAHRPDWAHALATGYALRG